MAEISSNVLLAKEFAEIFDGFPIGFIDLTQLPFGIDRDSSILSELFDENSNAAGTMISMVVKLPGKQAPKLDFANKAQATSRSSRNSWWSRAPTASLLTPMHCCWESKTYWLQKKHLPKPKQLLNAKLQHKKQ